MTGRFACVCVTGCVVFHSHLRHRGLDEADRDEPQVLLPSRLEHFRLHHRRPVAGRAGAGGRSGAVRAALVSFGKNAVEILVG